MAATIKSALLEAKLALRSHVDVPELDAEILLAAILQQPRSYLFSHNEMPLTQQQAQHYQQYIARRLQGEPVAYIVGEKEFWSLALYVTPDTLTPRPETELLVETVLRDYAKHAQLVVADLGTGTGAIALALAHERPEWEMHATDKHIRTLAIAKRNAQRHQLTHVQFHDGDWLAALPKQPFDVIVSNPPYISDAEWCDVQADLTHEPVHALRATDDGLADIKIIVTTARQYLKPGGRLYLEHGYAQAKKIREFFVANGYTDVKTVRDLAQLERVTLGTLPLF